MSVTSFNDEYFPNCMFFHLKPVTHVIFDLDGTLIDTEEMNQEGWRQLAETYEKSLPIDFNFRFRGSPMASTLSKLKDELELPATIEELTSTLKSIDAKVYKEKKVELMRGVERLIKFLHRHQIPMAIGTSSSRKQAEMKMSSYPELFKLINHVTTSDDALEGKPAPDIYRIAARLFPARPKASSCLVFEDTTNGLKAAVAANMQCIFVPGKDIEVDDELKKIATLTLNSIEDFEPELFALPVMGKRKALKFIKK